MRFVGTFRSARIVGDPAVHEVVVDGPHTVRREGELLVIEDEGGEFEGAFAGAVKEERGRFRFRSGRRSEISIGLGSRPAPIDIRMNPDLPLDVELAAGTLNVRDVKAPITAEVSAGSAQLEGIAAPIDISVSAGSVHARGTLDHGDSRIQCDAGSVSLMLDPGSSVRIRSQVGLGKVQVPAQGKSGDASFVIEGERESIVGDGKGSLSIECNLGKVVVAVTR